MNPIFLDLGIVSIKWYAVFIFIALIVGGAYVIKESKRFGISEDDIINLAFWLIPFALVGARLYYVFFNWEYYSINKIEILEVWNGGLAIHGALLVGLLYIILYTKKKKIKTLRFLDIMVVALLIGQAIGRWGNFFNSEAYGTETTLEFLQNLHLPQFIIDGMYINGAYHQPTFLYESIWCIIGFILILIYRKYKYLKIGQLTSFYLVWYGLGRLLIEGLRTDSLMLGDFKMAQIVSILMIIIGVIMHIWAGRDSKFVNLYNEKKKVEFTDLPENIQQLQINNLNKIINETKTQQQPTTPQQPVNNQQPKPVDTGDEFKW